MALQLPTVLGLQEHCYRLAYTVAELWQHDPTTVTEGDEVFEWSTAAEWLDLASSVEKVEVATGRFDESLMWCGTACDYEDARSKLYSQLVAQLTVFSFVWGAFEIITKVIEPASIPKSDRINGANSPTSRLAYFIRSMPTDATHQLVLAQVQHLLARHPAYGSLAAQLQDASALGPAGQGIDIVRRIRNKFAHGAASLPPPDGWGASGHSDNELLALCTRLVLLTIQIALSRYYAGKHFDIWAGRAEDGLRMDADVHEVLSQVHLAEPGPAPDPGK
jgi:hypothetical protein